MSDLTDGLVRRSALAMRKARNESGRTWVGMKVTLQADEIADAKAAIEATGVVELRSMVEACEPWLKEDETPAERIERECRDTQALMKLLAREKEKTRFREIAHEAPPQTGMFLLWSPEHPGHVVPVRADIYFGAMERESRGKQPKHLRFGHFTHWLPTPLPNSQALTQLAKGKDW